MTLRCPPTRPLSHWLINWASRHKPNISDPFVARLITLAGTLVIVAWTVLGLGFLSNYQQDMAALNEQAMTTAHAMGERSMRPLLVAEHLLRVVDADIRKMKSGINTRTVLPILRRLNPIFDEIQTIFFVNAHGVSVGHSNQEMTSGLRYDESEFFRMQSSTPSLALFIEKPESGMPEDERTITVSRRVSSDTGVFLGVLAAVIRTDALATEFAKMTIGEKGSVALIHIPSKSIIARQPDLQTSFGKQLPHDGLEDTLALASQGFYRANKSIDGEKRTYAYRRLGDLPLAVSVGLSTSDMHAAVLKKFHNYLMVAMALTLFIGYGTVVLLSTHRREVGLKNSMSKWQQTFEQASWGVAIVSRNGKNLEYLNQAYAHMHGYRVEELANKPIDTVYSAEARKQVDDALSQTSKASHFRYESFHKHKDGHLFPVVVDMILVLGPENEIAIGAVNIQDVTEMHRAQENMRIATELFKNTFEVAPVGMVIANTDGRYTRVNQAMSEFSGYSKSELSSLNYVDITHPDDIEQSVRAWHSLQDGESRSVQMEKRFIRKDGQVLWTDVSVSTIRDMQGDIVNFVIVISDITGRKESALKLAESKQKLRALAAYQEEALEQERKHIAREIHDELGQLLTALKMDISLVRLRFGENNELLGRIDEMRLLIDKTINVVRQVASNLRPAVLDHGLAPAIEWLATDFSSRWSIRCKTEIDDRNNILDDGQSTAVFRVIQESLTNIARHAQAHEVVISMRISGKQLEVDIKDDGCGFEKRTVSKEKGFGLFGMRERIKPLGGTLRINSILGKGTTVSIRLPLLNSERS